VVLETGCTSRPRKYRDNQMVRTAAGWIQSERRESDRRRAPDAPQ